MESVTKLIPSPEGDDSGILQALLFDAWYDPFRGVIVLVKVQQGTIKVNDEITMMATGNRFIVEELGTYNPKQEPKSTLQACNVDLGSCLGLYVPNSSTINRLPVAIMVISSFTLIVPCWTLTSTITPRKGSYQASNNNACSIPESSPSGDGMSFVTDSINSSIPIPSFALTNTALSDSICKTSSNCSFMKSGSELRSGFHKRAIGRRFTDRIRQCCVGERKRRNRN